MADDNEISQFKRITVPLIRRIYPQLIANEIVSVQPLLGPTGLKYYEQFRYSGEQPRRKNIKPKRYRFDDPWEN